MICLGLVFAAGIYGRFAPFGSSVQKKTVALFLAIIVCSSIGYAGYSLFASNESSSKWEKFTVESLAAAHEEGRPVLANFTAQWCMNCQYNKHNTLNSKEVRTLAEQKNILFMEVDLTDRDSVAEGLLKHLGSRSVPFLALFPGKDPYHPLIMRDLISKKRLLDAMKSQ
jgi:thiol:disulfide interchange protein